MRYENVCIEGLGYVIPDEVVTTAWLEEQIAPVYELLGIPKGYIERLTGIHEHRWWDAGVLPSQGAAWAGRKALANAGVGPEEIGVLINASVCRDYIEPATAAFVHHELGLPHTTLNFDMINACLGFVNAMVMVANMIELGQIEAGMVVASESPRDGQMATIEALLRQPPTRQDLRDNLASFTLGAASVAMVLRHRSHSRTGKRLLGGFSASDTTYSDLCVAQHNWMKTNSSRLLTEGAKVVVEAFAGFKRELGWSETDIDKLFTHQVSEPQRRVGVYETLNLRQGIDYPTLSYLGNTASVAAPLCMALAIESGWLKDGDRVCLLGAGSGVSSIILGIQW